MQKKESLVTELNWLTDKISSQVWTLNISTLGTTWSLIIAAGNIPNNFRLASGATFPILGLCVLAMMAELVQYLAGYTYNRKIFRALERTGKTEFEYDSRAFLYRLRVWCFNGKIAMTIVAAILLLAALLTKFT